MINADISNIWGDVSLRDLLEQEDRILNAHRTLCGGTGKGAVYGAWMNLPDTLPEKMNKYANLIRLDSDILVVIGDNGATRGIRAIIQLLQGLHRNMGKGQGDPMILFTGDSLSPGYWNDLTHLLEGKDYSLCVIAGDTLSTESAIALRNLKWMLERKYGTNDAMCRIYAVTDPQQGMLRQMARDEKWETFDLPAGIGDDFSLLCPGCWLPLALAGIDLEGLLNGIRNAREEYNLGSFENPVWLYTAARKLMAESGKAMQLLTSPDSGMAAFGKWWQSLFTGSTGMAPLVMELSSDQAVVDHLIRNAPRSIFETMLRFEAPEKAITIAQDKTDLDGLKALAGEPMATVQEDAFFRMQNSHADSGSAVMTLECPRLCEETLGELIWFFQLSRALELML